MGTTTGFGRTPSAPPVSATVAQGLFNERVINKDEVQKVLRVMPPYGLQSLDGSYPIETGWTGYNTADGDITLARPEHATDFPPVTQSMSSADFTTTRKMIGQFAVNRTRQAALMAASGVDSFAKFMRDVMAKASQGFAVEAWAAVATTGNYASGHQADSGNITSASFSLLDVMDTAITAFRDAQQADDDTKFVVSIAEDAWLYVPLLTEFKESPAINRLALSGRLPESAIDGWLKTYYPQIETVQKISSRYSLAGTITPALTMAVHIAIANPGTGNSAWKLTTPDGGADLWDVRSDYEKDNNSDEYVVDGWWGMNLQNNQAHYLSHTLGS